MEQILLTYGFLNETVSAIMMLYKNIKAIARSSNGDTEYIDSYIDIVIEVLQGDILASILFIICLDYVLSLSVDLMKEKVLN